MASALQCARKLAAIAGLTAGVWAFQAAGASASIGELTQKPGDLGCVSALGVCGPAAALDGPVSIGVSPDGSSLYAAVLNSDAVAVFDRAPDGTLTQKAGTAGCISETGAGPCADGVALDGANGLAISPDGASVYVTSAVSDAVAVFDRAPDGTLTQKAGTAGCISETGAGPCADGVALDGAVGLAISADGANVYVGASTSSAVAVFDRAPDGTLTQKTGSDACIDEDGDAPCADGAGLVGAAALVVDPDGTGVYVLSTAGNGAVAALVRAPDGSLTQNSGPAGCTSQDFLAPCTQGTALSSPTAIAISPDGATVYVAAATDDAIALFDTASNGTLTQKAGSDACVDEQGDAPCADGDGLDAVRGVDVSPDGDHVYTVASGSDAVAVFDRAPDGTLIQKAGDAGCVDWQGDPPCATGRVLNDPIGVTVSPDGQSLYAAVGTSDAISIFDREVAPETALISGPSGATPNPDASFGFSSSQSGSTFECRLDGPGASTGTYSACTSPHTYTDLADGDYTFLVRASSAVGNTDVTPAATAFTIDAPPETKIESGPGALTNEIDQTFAFSSNQPGSTFECRLDGPGVGGGFAACQTAQVYTKLANGLYTFHVRATDTTAHTDASPATRAFVVDSRPPEPAIDSGPAGPTADAMPVFGFSADESGSTFECRLDGGGYKPCSSPVGYGQLADGEHVLDVRATDPAGNVNPAPATRRFRIDTSVDASAAADARQRVDTDHRGHKLRVSISVAAEEAVEIRSTGTIGLGGRTYRLKPQAAALAAGGEAVLRLKLAAKRHARKIAAALSEDRRARARVQVTLTDALGNEAAAAAKVRLTK